MTAPSSPPRQSSTGPVMLSGAAWAIAMRWSIRLLGLISTAILARLLTPADFGIVAMAGLVVALVDSFSEFGTEMLLMRQADATRAHCDTAWTFRLLQGVATAAIILAAAPFAARYFDEPRLPTVMVVLALIAVVSSTSNIGMTLVRKELKFAVDFRFGLYNKLGAFFPTIALAYLLRDYWALVYGSLAGALVSVIVSYRMHPYRPRLSLTAYREYLTFSIDVVASNIARLLKSKVDVFVLGGEVGAAGTGQYNVASELARMGTQEIVIPAWRGLFPAFAALRPDPQKFNAAYGRLVGVIAMLCLPLGIGLWALAQDVVPVLLGPQWTSAIEPLRWLALGAALLALSDTFGGSILFVSGHERRAAALLWLHVVLLVPAVVLGSRLGGVVILAQAVALVALVMVPVSALVVMGALSCGPALLMQPVWRPLLASFAMGAALHLLPMHSIEIDFIRLVARSAIGTATYLLTLGALWLASGQPDGVEGYALDWISSRLRRNARA